MKSERVVTEGFHARVFAMVRQVPSGRVTTYGDVASALGLRTVARHVGFALAALHEEDVPWHRVLNARGAISAGEADRCALQRTLLELEGVRFNRRGCVDLKKFRHIFDGALP